MSLRAVVSPVPTKKCGTSNNWEPNSGSRPLLLNPSVVKITPAIFLCENLSRSPSKADPISVRGLSNKS